MNLSAANESTADITNSNDELDYEMGAVIHGEGVVTNLNYHKQVKHLKFKKLYRLSVPRMYFKGWTLAFNEHQ